MEKLRFKDFVWPRDPETYKVHYDHELVYEEVAIDVLKLKGLSEVRRTVTGSGVFTGETAYADFKRLAALCAKKDAGELIHPIWGKLNAFLMELDMTQEPREDHVAYSFKFLELTSDGAVAKG